jgi:16S rRNA (guanine527-N7)-methyltransferase
LGPGPVRAHLDHAAAFLVVVNEPPDHAVDLGSGGGLPGLVLARHWQAASFALVESSARRAAFLRSAIDSLRLANVVVVQDRAERIGQMPQWRGWADVVVARSFAVPAVTAECAAPLLRVGGQLVVSEPPTSHPDRWPERGLAMLGLGSHRLVTTEHAHVAVLTQQASCPDRYPRRVGIPAKRPLF